VDSETQGVALGWHSPALSAPEDVDLVVQELHSQEWLHYKI
jgi:hypothetical protein